MELVIDVFVYGVVAAIAAYVIVGTAAMIGQ